MDFKENNDNLLYDYLINGNPKAYDLLFESNLNLIYYTINSVCKERNIIDNYVKEDLVSIGAIGLSKAINKFDKDRIGEVAFSTFASLCIKNEIFMELRKKKKDVMVLSIDEPINEELGDMKLEEVLASDDNFIEDITENEKERFKVRKIYEAINLLSEKEKKVLELYYGFNGNNRLTQDKIASKLRISQGEISRMLDKINSMLAIELDEFKRDYVINEIIDTEDKSIIKRMNDTFIAFFPNENIYRVRQYLLLLPKRQADIISLYYGLDGVNCLDYDDISKKCNIDVEKIDRDIERGIRSLQRIVEEGKIYGIKLVEDYKLDKYGQLIIRYGRSKVEKILEMVNPLNREIIRLRYEDHLTQGKIAKMYNLSQGSISARISNSLDKVEQLLEESKLEKFYDEYDNFSKEDVDRAISKLNDEDKWFLSVYYGLNGEFLSPKGIAKIRKVSLTSVYSCKNRIINTIRVYLYMERDAKAAQEVFYEYFNGIDKVKVDKAVDSLEFLTKEVLCLCYGLNGEILDKQRIARKYNLKEREVRELLNNGLNEIEKFLEFSSDKFYLLFEGYSKGEIDEALSKLYKNHQDMIRLYYGMDGKKLTVREIAVKFDTSSGYVYACISRSIGKIKNNLRNPKAYVSSQEKFYKNFQNYLKEDVDAVLESLDIKSYDIISLIYGLNGEKFSIKEIADKYGVDIRSIHNNAYQTINKIQKSLDDLKNGNKSDKFYLQFKDYKREKIDEAVNSLPLKYQKILKDYYGLDGEFFTQTEISKKYEIPFSTVNYCIKDGLNKIEKFLESNYKIEVNREEISLEQLVDIYGKEKVNMIIDAFSDSEKRFLFTYCLGLKSESSLEKVSVDLKQIQLAKKRMIERIESLLKKEKEEELAQKRQKKLFLKVNSDDLTVIRKAMQGLGNREIYLINAYYGLNDKGVKTIEELSKELKLREEYIKTRINTIVNKISKNIADNVNKKR